MDNINREDGDKSKEREPEPVYELYDTDTYKFVTSGRKIPVYRENMFIQEVSIDEVSDFSLATFLMSNRVGMWLPKGTFQDSMEIGWNVVPIKVKRIKRDGKREVAVEAIFVDHDAGDKLTPDLKNWRLSICTLMASHPGRSPALTIRNLIKSTYPNAKHLSDLTSAGLDKDGTSRARTTETQTTERIYTFPIPIPMPITAECVTMGGPEIKESVRAAGERWHACLGHIGPDIIQNTAKAYPQYKIPKQYRTDNKLQSEKCECCEKCKAKITRSVKSSNVRAVKYLERVHMDVCGPLQMKTTEGYVYFTVFYDEFTRYR